MVKRILKRRLDPKELQKLNKYIVQDGFHGRLKDIGRLNILVRQNPSIGGVEVHENDFFREYNFSIIDSLSKTSLNPEKGYNFSKDVIFTGYDESKLQFDALEGTANITSHSMLSVAENKYYPISLISIYFYTRSKSFAENSEAIKYSEKPSADSNRDYALDRSKFILDHVVENSILFIDGPIIGGNLSSYTIDLVTRLHEKDVLPIFIVKNSDSNLVINNIEEIKGRYNTDLHWAYKYLKPGERTNFFHYKDRVNPNNTKVFSYIKSFKYTSPQRVELHPETYTIYQNYIEDTFNLLFYLILVQGNTNNPQIRPIAIAEKYAREIITTINTRTIFHHTSLVPTINQNRFGV